MKSSTQATTTIFYPVELTEAKRQQYEALRLTDSEVQSLQVRPASQPIANPAA